MVQNLVWVGLTGQSHVVLGLSRESRFVENMSRDMRRHGVIGQTLILRGPSRRPRLLLGVSMLIILSRPLSREPNTFPPRFFFPLSSVTARSRDRDLRRTWVQKVASSSTRSCTLALMQPTHLLSGLKARIPTSGISVFSSVPFLL